MTMGGYGMKRVRIPGVPKIIIFIQFTDYGMNPTEL
jgi:hypothetical protein